jgi:hypothetical protein
MALSTDQKNKLIEALIKGGYNLIDAKNAANGPTAENLVKEYLKTSNITSFINIWINRFADYDKAWGYQCVDLMRYYVKFLFNIDAYKIIPANVGAYQMFAAYKSDKYFTKVINNPKDQNQIPPIGAIMFWKPYQLFLTGKNGHVGMVQTPNILNNIIFNQNWPTNSNCHLQKFGWRGVAGWLIPKV